MWTVKVGFLVLFPLLLNSLNSLADHIYVLLAQLNPRNEKHWEQVFGDLIYKSHLSTKFIFIPSSIFRF